MKIPGAKAEGFVAKPPRDLAAILVYGPDHGLVRERAQKLAAAYVDDPTDPFSVTELSGESLAADPAQLADSANAGGLFGGAGRRLVRIARPHGTLTESLAAYLADPNPQATILIEAGDLGPRAALRKLAETGENIAALPCYSDDVQAVGALVRRELQQAGFRLDSDAEQLLAERLVGDRGLARAALDKLVTYMGKAREITLAEVRQAIGDSGETAMDDAALAVFDGNLPALAAGLDRLFHENAPVGVLRVVQNHARRLHEARSLMESGMSADKAMSRLRPPIFFKTKPSFRAQLQRWDMAALSRALAMLLEAEKRCKQSGPPDRALTERALIATARLVPRGGAGRAGAVSRETRRGPRSRPAKSG